MLLTNVKAPGPLVINLKHLHCVFCGEINKLSSIVPSIGGGGHSEKQDPPQGFPTPHFLLGLLL